MSNQVIKKIWVSDNRGTVSLRIDWSNQRHHSILIEKPYGPVNVAMAFAKASSLLVNEAKQQQKKTPFGHGGFGVTAAESID